MRKDKMVTEVLGEDITLTPSEICEKRFRRSMTGGYDRSEVERFLERVADVIEDLIDQVRALKTANQEQKAQIDQYREMEATLRQALSSSQKFAEDTLAAARREAEAILEEARLKRARTEMDAQRIPEALSRDIQVLEQQRSRLRLEMVAILETHRKLLDSYIPEQPALMPLSQTNIAYLGTSPDSEIEKEPEAEDDNLDVHEEMMSDLPEAMIFDSDADEDSDEDQLLFLPEEPKDATGALRKPKDSK